MEKENATGPSSPEENSAKQLFVITHKFQLKLGFIDRLCILFNKDVFIINLIKVDAPTNPVESNSEIHVIRGKLGVFIVWFNKKFRKAKK